jgi:prepilin-type N-terminal cleavage/methylation domain-containing protein
MFKRSRLAVSLPEVLVTLAILAALASIVLPAISIARSRARDLQCQSNLHQVCNGVLQHSAIHRAFPTNGWGAIWFGMSDRGFGASQPGGWIYNTLPFLEENTLRSRAPNAIQATNPSEFEAINLVPIPWLLCPDKSGGVLISVVPQYLCPVGSSINHCTRTDFAINGGSVSLERVDGPLSLQTSNRFIWPSLEWFNGISYIRSRVRAEDIQDGQSHVLLLGEKYAKLPDVKDSGYDQPFLSGDCFDIRRSTASPPEKDYSDAKQEEAFGSSHHHGVNLAFCDGAVHQVSFDVDPEVFQRFGGRNDGGRIND